MRISLFSIRLRFRSALNLRGGEERLIALSASAIRKAPHTGFNNIQIMQKVKEKAVTAQLAVNEGD
jgi:hypothetical protein